MCQYGYVYYSLCGHAEFYVVGHCPAATAVSCLSHSEVKQTRDDINITLQQSRHGTVNYGHNKSVPEQEERRRQQGDGWMQEGASRQATVSENEPRKQSQMPQPLYSAVVVGKCDPESRLRDSPPTALNRTAPVSLPASSPLTPAARLAARFQQDVCDRVTGTPQCAHQKASKLYLSSESKGSPKYRSVETGNIITSVNSEHRLLRSTGTKHSITEGVENRGRACSGGGRIFSGVRKPTDVTTNLPNPFGSSDSDLDLASSQNFPVLSASSNETKHPSSSSAVADRGRSASSSWAQVARLISEDRSHKSSSFEPTATSDAGTVSTSLTSFYSDTYCDSNTASGIDSSPSVFPERREEMGRVAKPTIISPIITEPDPVPRNPRKTLPMEWLQDPSTGHAPTQPFSYKKSIGTLRSQELPIHEKPTSPTKTITKPFSFATARRAAEREAKVKDSPTSPTKSTSSPFRTVKGKTLKTNPSNTSHSHSRSTETAIFHPAQPFHELSGSTIDFSSASEVHSVQNSAADSPSRIPRLTVKFRRDRGDTHESDRTPQLSDLLQMEFTLSQAIESLDTGKCDTTPEVTELVDEGESHINAPALPNDKYQPKSNAPAFSFKEAKCDEDVEVEYITTGPQKSKEHVKDHAVTHESSRPLKDNSSHDVASVVTSITEEIDSRTTSEEGSEQSLLTDMLSECAGESRGTQWSVHYANDLASPQKSPQTNSDMPFSESGSITQDPVILHRGPQRKNTSSSVPSLTEVLNKNATMPSKRMRFNAEAVEFVPTTTITAEIVNDALAYSDPFPPQIHDPVWVIGENRVRQGTTDIYTHPRTPPECFQQPSEKPGSGPTWKGTVPLKKRSPKKGSLRKKHNISDFWVDRKSDTDTARGPPCKSWASKSHNPQNRPDWKQWWYDGAFKSINGNPPTFESFYENRAQRSMRDTRSEMNNPWRKDCTMYHRGVMGPGSSLDAQDPKQYLGYGSLRPCSNINMAHAWEFGGGLCQACLPRTP